MIMKKNDYPDKDDGYFYSPDTCSWMIGWQDDDFFAEETEAMVKVGNRTYMVVVIYDITDNKKRYRMYKALLSYGERVQRSAFECHLTQRKYEKMIGDILPFIDEESDLLRIYKLSGSTEVRMWGRIPATYDEDVIII